MSELWVEKYRPSRLTDVMVEDSIVNKIKKQVSDKNINHSIFVGNPGTGKTSTALVIKNMLIKNDADVLFMNASGDRGIDTIRDVVLEFIKNPPIDSPIKLVIMDEADNLTPDAWKTLRNPIENPEINVNLSSRFIFTANFENGIPDFIKSRCDLYKFTDLPKEKLIDRAKYVLDMERVSYVDSDVFNIVNDCYPDMRSIINTIQNSVNSNNELVYAASTDLNKIVLDLFDRYLDFVINMDFGNASKIIFQIRNSLGNNSVNYGELVKKVYTERNIPIVMLPIMNHYVNGFNNAIDKRLHFISMLGDMMVVYRRIEG